jgi:hypothetical protein
VTAPDPRLENTTKTFLNRGSVEVRVHADREIREPGAEPGSSKSTAEWGQAVKAAKQESNAVQEDAGRFLAQRWGLEYREAHTLSIDPNALAIMGAAESRRLGALPLQLSADGPVLAVAEPTEERIAAVRAVAGDNATFVVVAQETLDALLNSKVFSVEPNGSRPNDSPLPVASPASADAAGEDVAVAETQPEPPSDTETTRDASEVEATSNGDGTQVLDTLLEQIAAGTGNLRSQVIHLTESLDANQRELREAKEQLAEANRASEGHNELVESLRSEIEGLKDDLARSRSQADATTARLRELVRTVQALTLEEEDASTLGEPTEDSERGSRVG